MRNLHGPISSAQAHSCGAPMESFHATTIVCVRREGRVVIGSDGQVTLGNTVMKGNARKVRRLGKAGEVVAGFAGPPADAFTLFELSEQNPEKQNSNQIEKAWGRESVSNYSEIV